VTQPLVAPLPFLRKNDQSFQSPVRSRPIHDHTTQFSDLLHGTLMFRELLFGPKRGSTNPDQRGEENQWNTIHGKIPSNADTNIQPRWVTLRADANPKFKVGNPTTAVIFSPDGNAIGLITALTRDGKTQGRLVLLKTIKRPLTADGDSK